MLELKKLGVDIRVAGDPHPYALEKIKEANIPFIHLSIRHRFDLQALRELSKIIRAWNVDLIHALSAKALTLSLFTTRSLPNIRVVAYRGTMGNLSHWSLLSRLSFLHPRISQIFCVSHAVRDYLLSLKVPEEKIITLYKGHQPEWYKSRASGITHKEIGIRNDIPIIGAVATFRPLKDLVTIVRAFEILAAEKPLQLLIVGKILDSKALKMINNSRFKESIFCVGHKENAFRYMPLCKATVTCSSRREGFPKAVVESMILGVPVIVTAVGGMAEFIQNEINGLVIPPRDPDALAYSISKLFRNEALTERLKKKAFETIETKLSVESYARETLNCYNTLLQRDI